MLIDHEYRGCYFRVGSIHFKKHISDWELLLSMNQRFVEVPSNSCKYLKISKI